MDPLLESNETHLGLSRGRSRGHGRARLFHGYHTVLRGSAAITSGIITALEETALLIPGIGPDLVSDLITNIIRQELIAYTQAMCRHYGVPLMDYLKPQFDQLVR